jgi:hydroxymethylglutaryl-CoA lyase
MNLADTTGIATPAAVDRMIRRVRKELPQLRLSLHLHDTRGLGVCPFVAGAAGNVPAEDAVNMFEASGISTGIDMEVLCETVAYLESLLERPLPGRMKGVLDSRRDCDMVPLGR